MPMHYLLAAMTLVAVFIMFLVISRTLNSITNLLIKLEYLVKKEYDLKKELFDVRRLLKEDAAKTENGSPAEPDAAKKTSL